MCCLCAAGWVSGKSGGRLVRGTCTRRTALALPGEMAHHLGPNVTGVVLGGLGLWALGLHSLSEEGLRGPRNAS